MKNNYLKNKKTPRCDGLPMEWYKMFWKQIGPLVHKVILYVIKQGKLHLSARRGIICLIPKKDRDSLFLKNWHPITLLNTDYKILVKVISARFKIVLDNLISKHQTGLCQAGSLALILEN